MNVYVPNEATSPWMIPDRLRIRDERGKRVAVFNPAWWRVDRWLFWAAIVLLRKPRGVADFTLLVREPGTEATRLETYRLHVYEVA